MTDIIGVGYLFKHLLFEFPFTTEKIVFENNYIDGFTAKNMNQKSQVIVHSYEGVDNFMVRLATKNPRDEMFLIKCSKQMKPEEAVARVQKKKKAAMPLERQDIFKMPKVSVNQMRNVTEMIGVKLNNDNFKEYAFSKFYEIVKLDIDEKGAKVENIGVIAATKGKISRPANIKEIILNKPFWVVMRESESAPYFVSYIKVPVEK